MNIKNILRSQRLKNSGYASALVALVIALVYLANVVVLLFANHFGWYFFITEQYDLSIGSAADTLFSEIDTSAGKVKILFCDVEENTKTNRQTDFIYRTANSLQARYPDLIDIEYVNLWLEPNKVAPYIEDEDGDPITLLATDVIIDYQGEHLLCPATSFFTLDESDYVTAYNGEEVFVSNILWVTAKEHPTAYFTTNHGESMPSPLYYALVRAGYRVELLDLASVERVPEDAGLVLISSPLYDFQRTAAGAAFVSELTKLEDYLASGGKLFASVNPNYIDRTPKLLSFLAEYGLSVSDGVLIDENGALPGSGGYSLVGSFAEGEVASRLADAVGVDRRTILSYAAPLMTYEGERAVAEPILLSPAGAVCKLRNGELAAGGGRPMLAMATLKEGEGKILFVGSSYLAASDIMNGAGYGNKPLVYALLSELGAENVPLGIDAVTVDRSAIEDLSLGEVRLYTAITVAVIPALLLAAGLFFCYRRKIA